MVLGRVEIIVELMDELLDVVVFCTELVVRAELLVIEVRVVF